MNPPPSNQQTNHPPASAGLDVILIHGMARTPLAMGLLQYRLRQAGLRPSLFGYSPTVERFEPCTQRLVAKIRQTAGSRPYALVGHSLGTVLIRGVLPALEPNPPVACFFLAPPSVACRAARFFAGNPVYRWLMGEMGQKLASDSFMAGLPKPIANTWIYAGTKGLPGSLSPFGDEPNDGILMLAETRVDGIPVVEIPATHTFIMNSRRVAEDIAKILDELMET